MTGKVAIRVRDLLRQIAMEHELHIISGITTGGYGERIVAGLAVNDNALLLAGAVPAALLAIIIESGFGVAERWLVPRGLATVGFSK